MEFVHFTGKKYDCGECLGCFCNENLFDLILETDNFVVSQDFELPIEGFIIISSKRHICSINDMTDNERRELIDLINRVLKVAKSLEICEKYNIIWEEKEGCHFHVWLMPRHKWMTQKFGNPTKNISKIFDFAKINFRTEEEVKKCIDLLKQNLNK